MSKFNYRFQATRRSGVLHLPVSQSISRMSSYDKLTVEL